MTPVRRSFRHQYAHFAAGDEFRVIQFTPPGSGGSVIFGKNVTAAAPGSAQGLCLIVSDIEAARAKLLGRGVEISEVFHDADGCTLSKRRQQDANWPDWYPEYIVREQAGKQLPS